MNVEFEWDEAKRQETLKCRGLDFAGLSLFDWDTAMIAEDVRKNYGETRYAVLGFIGGIFVGFIYTIRGHRIRVISLRKANSRERKLYEQFRAVHEE